MKLRPFLFSIFLSAFGLVLPAEMHGQFIGYTSPQTVSSRPYGNSNVSCTGTPQLATVQNLGQSVHQAVFEGVSVTSGTMVIQGSNDGVSFQNISDTASLNSTANQNLRGDGYYAVVQISVVCPATGGTFSVFYSGTSVTSGTNTGSAQITQYDKALARAAPSSTNLAVSVQTPFGSSGGSVYFQYSSGTISAGATLVVQCTGNETFTLVPAFTLVGTALTFQQIPITASNCSNVTVTYTAGGAGTSTITLDYVFSLPGQSVLQSGTTYTHVTTTTATPAKGTGGLLHALTVNTGAAGTISIFDLPVASCTGTPATNIVAVITATATTLQTFTYDVNLLTGICVKASVAMDFTVSAN
jgi:hypothetical protein